MSRRSGFGNSKRRRLAVADPYDLCEACIRYIPISESRSVNASPTTQAPPDTKVGRAPKLTKMITYRPPVYHEP